MQAMVSLGAAKSDSTGKHKRAVSEFATAMPASPGLRTTERRRGAEMGNYGTKHKKVFESAKDMKDELRKNLHVPKYDVADFYWQEGVCQQVARSNYFENLTLVVITFNAGWMAVDTDENTSDTLLDAKPIFIIVENFFCLYFSCEIVIRFCSFQIKRNCMRDAWFVFDCFMVTLMVAETWVMTVILLAIGGGNGGAGLGNAGMLRLLRLMRLSRMARMARLLREMPELMILIKGMISAIRSVFFTLVLLCLLMYVFAILFRQVCADNELEETYFPSVPKAVHALLIHGVLLDNVGAFVVDLEAKSGWVTMLLFYAFILLAAITVMNMLIGVLCEVIGQVAEYEGEEMAMAMVSEKLEEVCILCKCQKHDDGELHITKENFLELLQHPEVAPLLEEIKVDAMGLVDLVDTIFDSDDGSDERILNFADLIDVMMDHRLTEEATVQEITELRKFVAARITSMETKFRHKDIELDSTLLTMSGYLEKYAVSQGVPLSEMQAIAAKGGESALDEAAAEGQEGTPVNGEVKDEGAASSKRQRPVKKMNPRQGPGGPILQKGNPRPKGKAKAGLGEACANP